MMLRLAFPIAIVSLGLWTSGAQADLDGHGPDLWRVIGVAANDMLNARMGPGTDTARPNAPLRIFRVEYGDRSYP